MSETNQPIGSVSWIDITIPKADELRSFYSSVVGWKSSELDMGGYRDFCMNLPGSGKTVAGICHARGENVDLPAQWLIYITVANVEKSAEQCVALGGKVLAGPRPMGGHGTVAVIQDPAGAVAALFEPAK
jgi:predicted enzyme related to lactoylglutathione lyase